MFKKINNQLGILTSRHFMLAILSCLSLQAGIIIGYNYNLVKSYFILLPFLGIIIFQLFVIFMLFWNRHKMKNIEMIEEKMLIFKNNQSFELNVVRLKYNGQYIADPKVFHISDYKYFPLSFKVSELLKNLKNFKEEDYIQLNVKF